MSLYPPRRTPEEETRLSVLYTIKRLPACHSLQLQQFLFDYNEMNYFDMMFALNELCANGQVIREKKSEHHHTYSITPAGEEVLALFGNRIPASLCRFLDERGGVFLEKMMEDEQYPRQIRHTENNEYVVYLGICEKGAPIMQLTISLPTYKMALDMANNWPKRAGRFYGQAIFTLSEEEK